ncbi:hypothetical protein EMN47_20455, partial [Prolixibacteraceae bacterium JC049]|nr:hypothetical protein [Prolixibacteraceae bacterium JC049]
MKLRIVLFALSMLIGLGAFAQTITLRVVNAKFSDDKSSYGFDIEYKCSEPNVIWGLTSLGIAYNNETFGSQIVGNNKITCSQSVIEDPAYQFFFMCLPTGSGNRGIDTQNNVWSVAYNSSMVHIPYNSTMHKYFSTEYEKYMHVDIDVVDSNTTPVIDWYEPMIMGQWFKLTGVYQTEPLNIVLEPIDLSGPPSLEVVLANNTIGAGENNRATLTIKKGSGDVKTNLSGNQEVKINGIAPAPDGSYGSFNGIPITMQPQIFNVNFSNGVATPDLVLNRSALAVDVSFEMNVDAVDISCLSGGVDVIPDALNTLAFVNQPEASLGRGGGALSVQPILEGKDQFLNSQNLENTGLMQGEIQKQIASGLIISTTTRNAILASGQGVFSDLSVTTFEKEDIACELVVKYYKDGNTTNVVGSNLIAVTSSVFIVKGMLPLAANVSKTDPTTFNGTDGTITVSNQNGGSGTYEYSYDGGSNWELGSTKTDLSANSYSVQMRDANNHSDVIDLGTINLYNPFSATVASTNPTING